MESNICNFGIFDCFFFLFLAVRTVVGTTVMFLHFHAKSLEIAKQTSERLYFSAHEPCIHAPWPTRPRAVGEYEYGKRACFSQILRSHFLLRKNLRYRRKKKKLTLFDQIVLKFKLEALYSQGPIIIIYFYSYHL